ncbi:hypothetical protein J4468_04095 [Candidatus Woesearchaeota archaeon]|nr:hypothetical protein [Candidatus Woesearchaeota archaeon]
MKNFRPLDSRETKKILTQIEEHFGIKEKFTDYAMLMDPKDKVYLVSKSFIKISSERLKINNIGVYFGRYESNQLRLSIEGTQWIKPKKNVLILDEKQISDWMKGFDIDIDNAHQGILAIKHNKDFYGCGKAGNGRLFNFVSKNRRLSVVNE